jgi:hypothetical protein
MIQSGMIFTRDERRGLREAAWRDPKAPKLKWKKVHDGFSRGPSGKPRKVWKWVARSGKHTWEVRSSVEDPIMGLSGRGKKLRAQIWQDGALWGERSRYLVNNVRAAKDKVEAWVHRHED